MLILLALFCLTSSQYDWSTLQDTITYFNENAAFPGCVLSVANATHTIYLKSFGKLTYSDFPLMLPTTVFDIASLTKVTATLSAVMHLHARKRIDIHDKVTQYIPEYGGGKQQTTIQNLLLHNAGLLPDYPSVDIQKNTKKQIMDFVYACPLNYPIGTKFVYSDLSFILLGQIVERITKMKMQDYTLTLMQQMQMPGTTYLGKAYNVTEPKLYNIAPTEYSSGRKGLIRGVVHDPTAYIFDGVAGHAGLFSTAADLTRYMQIHLNKGLTPEGARIYPQETVQLFYTRVDGLPYENRRALGWDTLPISNSPPCGTLFSLNSFGHTGFTGTMIWADRDKGLIVVLLANRVHPTAQSTLISQARTKIVDAVVTTMRLALEPTIN